MSLSGRKRPLTSVLLTGASGYLGGRLAARLDGAPGTDLRALVRRPVPTLPVDDQIVCPLPAGDDALLAACASVDVVVHLAGSNEVVAAKEPDLCLSETIVGTRQLASAAARAGVQRFVYLSTVHVYGPPADGARLTEQVVPAPAGAYAIARLASEHVARVAQGDGMTVVVLRLTNSVGAPVHPTVDRWSLVANDLCRQAAVNGSLELRSDGLQWRDFIPMIDVCRIIENVLAPEPVASGTYNLGMGEPMTVRGLAELVQAAAEELTGRRPPLVAPVPRAQPPAPHHVDVDRLGRLGIRATGTVRSAIEETLSFCLEHEAQL